MSSKKNCWEKILFAFHLKVKIFKVERKNIFYKQIMELSVIKNIKKIFFGKEDAFFKL